MTNFRWSRVFGACILVLTVSAPAYASYWLTWIDELSGPGPFRGYQFNGELLCIGSRPDQATVSRLSADFTNLQTAFDAYQTAADNKGRAQALEDYSNRRQELQTLIDGAAKSADTFPLCRFDRENAIAAIVFEYGRFDDNNKKHQDKYTGRTNLSNAQLVAYIPLHRLVPGRHFQPNPVTRAVEFGAGAGTYHFTGTTVKNTEAWMISVPRRIRIIPVEFWHRNTADADDSGTRRRRVLQTFQFKVGFDYIPTKARWNQLFQSTGGGAGFDRSKSQELIWTWGLQLDLGQVAWALLDRSR
jgi:hypothetical protein